MKIPLHEAHGLNYKSVLCAILCAPGPGMTYEELLLRGELADRIDAGNGTVEVSDDEHGALLRLVKAFDWSRAQWKGQQTPLEINRSIRAFVADVGKGVQ